eukprot:g13063.t1
MRSRSGWLGLLAAAVAMSSSGIFASNTTDESSSPNCIRGYCDYMNNSAECEYDGGDCCSCTCKVPPGGELHYCTGGFACIDPAASCVDDDDVTADMVENCGYIGAIGDGYCDDYNNNELCKYDGGDCCECTCVSGHSSYYGGCNSGFACIDPYADCVDDDDITVEIAENCGGYVGGIGDGYCNIDNNNELCNYDGGDCCECTCASDDDYWGCSTGFACIDPHAECVDDDDITAEMVENCGYVEGIGDGYCNIDNNNELCNFDGGDCCECTCVSDDHFWGCNNGFACIDPNAECVDDDDITANLIENCGYVTGFGDGRCDTVNNSEECQYDGGDCCECTCIPNGDDDYHGCKEGFACIDPAASCVDDDDITVGHLTACDPVRMSDGYCDDDHNNLECNYDGGDCCECTCEKRETSDDFWGGRYGGCAQFACVDPSAPCVADDDITVNMLANCPWVNGIGNGYCDLDMNTPECNYDGGDCCSCTCQEGEFADESTYLCTEFFCIDPSASCVDDDDFTVDMLAHCPSIYTIGDGYCDPEQNTPECNYDGGDCCECTCESDEVWGCSAYRDWFVAGFDCQDPDAPCFGVAPTMHYQQMKVSENGNTFKVSRFADGRSTPYRIYFWNEALTGSSYRFDGNGDLVYFKAGSEIYYDISQNGSDGAIEFSRKAESHGGKMYNDDKAEYSAKNSFEEFSCNQCVEAIYLVCGITSNEYGGLWKFCQAIDTSVLGSDGADSVNILCNNAHSTCDKALSVCASACGVGGDVTFTSSPSSGHTDDDHSHSGYVEAGTKTIVSVTATAYDERLGHENGCGHDGCTPALAYDGSDDVESRWSCSEDIVPGGGQCKIEFTFEQPQDIMDIQVDFWKGDERTRYLKVLINGHKVDEFESQRGLVSTSLGIQKHGVHTVTLESIGLHTHEWISLLEVHFYVDP